MDAQAASQAGDVSGLLQQQQTQMESTMAYQSSSAQLNMEFQMHQAATDRLNAMAESIGSTASRTSQQLSS